MRRRTRPTIIDVARRAGVSQTTVSYVLSGPAERTARISDDTRTRILEVVAEIGYVPNQSARSLRLQRSNHILVLVSRITSLYSQEMVRTIGEALARHSLSFSVRIGADADGIRGAIDALKQNQADGLIIEAPDEHVEMLREAAADGHAIMSIGTSQAEEEFDVVSFDDIPAIAEAMNHLIDRGHHRFVLLSSVQDIWEHRILAAYRQLMSRGVPDDAITLLHCPHDRIAAYEMAHTFLPRHPNRLAVYAGSDVSAIGVLWATLSLRRRVPEDIAIIGHGNNPETHITVPPLTSLGPLNPDFSKAADLMASRLVDRSLGGRHFVEPFQLSIRDSS